MIQRPQSLFLLTAILLLVGFVLLSGSWLTSPVPGYTWLLPLAFGLTAITALSAFAAILMYKQREKQRSVLLVTQWLDLLLVACVLGGLYVQSQIPGAVQATGFLVALLPLLAYIMIRVARRGVEKDIATIRSMDRLR